MIIQDRCSQVQSNRDRTRRSRFRSSLLTFPGCVTMSESPDPSEPQFSHGKVIILYSAFLGNVVQVKGDVETAL